jgi:O-antigen/teichoic acid export membrane protein
MKKNSLSLGVLINIIGTFLLKGVSLFLLPVITRLLNTSDYGMMTVFNTWTALLAIVIGLQAYGSLTNARVEMDDDAYKAYMSNAILSVLSEILPWEL